MSGAWRPALISAETAADLRLCPVGDVQRLPPFGVGVCTKCVTQASLRWVAVLRSPPSAFRRFRWPGGRIEGPSPGEELRIGLLSCCRDPFNVAVSVAVKELMRGLQLLSGVQADVRSQPLPARGDDCRSELQRDVGRERGECGRVDRAV